MVEHTVYKKMFFVTPIFGSTVRQSCKKDLDVTWNRLGIDTRKCEQNWSLAPNGKNIPTCLTRNKHLEGMLPLFPRQAQNGLEYAILKQAELVTSNFYVVCNTITHDKLASVTNYNRRVV